MTDTRHKTDRELVIRRVFDAPRALVWRAWTDEEFANKWGPKGFTTPERVIDMHPGGAWHARMIAPDGKEYRQHGTVLEIVPQEKLSYTFIWDESPEEQTVITVTLADAGDKTEMTFVQTGFNSVDSRDGHNGGWNEAFDALADVVDDIKRRG